MNTVEEAFLFLVTFFTEKKIEHPKRSAEEILSFVLGVKKLDIYLEWKKPFLAKKRLVDLAKKRAEGTPLGYLFEEIEFYGLKYKVGREALLPRQETEILVDLARKKWKEKLALGGEFWDIFCGTGVIGLSFKKNFPQLKVTLSDISEKALFLAKENGEKNKVKVSFKRGDFLENFSKEDKVDFFVANPPYISEKEYRYLDPQVRLHEPKEALVSGKTGEEFYRRIEEELPLFLNRGAKIALEIGERQGEKVFQIFSDSFWKNKEILRDWSGKDRFFFLEIE